jgi:hypothetical protein
VQKEHNTLYAFYDLAAAPTTFDIVPFLLLAEGHRILWGCSNIHVIIVPGYHNGFRRKIPEFDIGESRLRVYNILVGCTQLVDSISGFTYCTHRNEAKYYFHQRDNRVYPEGYLLEKPIARYLWNPIKELLSKNVSLPSLSAPKFAKESIKSFVNHFGYDKKIITINLRNSSVQPSRNSDHSEWLKVCEYLYSNGYKIILIDDTDSFNNTQFQAPDYVYHGREFIWNVPLRTALYEYSFINLFVNNGPAALSVHNKYTKCLVFKILNENAPACSSKHFKKHGLEVGEPLFFAGPFNRWIWKDDEANVIIEEFENMVKEISK